jgi:integrase
MHVCFRSVAISIPRRSQRRHRFSKGGRGFWEINGSSWLKGYATGEHHSERGQAAARRPRRQPRFPCQTIVYRSVKLPRGKEYGRLLALYILPAIGARRLSDIRRVDVSRLHAEMSGTPRSANHCLAVISSIWNWAAKRDEVKAEGNPARGIERNPEQGKERFLSSNEMARLGDGMRKAETDGLPWTGDDTKATAKHIPKGPKIRIIDAHVVAAIRLLILTGARLSEILTGKWSYVDWERGIMFLPDSKTGRKPIYLSAAARAVLKDIPCVPGNPYIIPGEKRPKKRGEPKAPPAPRADLKRPWAAIAKAAGFTEHVQETTASPWSKAASP